MKTKLKFTKMHGLGNDFIVADNRSSGLLKLSQLSRKLCDRRFGVGADQLLLLQKSKKADFRMRIFNADGSEGEMCGNGIRCLAKYIWDKKLSRPLMQSEIMSKLKDITGEKADDFLKWISDPPNNQYPETVVSVVEEIRDSLVKEYGITPSEVIDR